MPMVILPQNSLSRQPGMNSANGRPVSRALPPIPPPPPTLCAKMPNEALPASSGFAPPVKIRAPFRMFTVTSPPSPPAELAPPTLIAGLVKLPADVPPRPPPPPTLWAKIPWAPTPSVVSVLSLCVTVTAPPLPFAPAEPPTLIARSLKRLT